MTVGNFTDEVGVGLDDEDELQERIDEQYEQCRWNEGFRTGQLDTVNDIVRCLAGLEKRLAKGGELRHADIQALMDDIRSRYL